MIKVKKKSFLLTNKIYKYKKIFNVIIKNIPRSIFSKLDHIFFREMIKDKIIHLFLIKNSGEISVIVTVIKPKDYKSLKKKIFLYFILRPIKLIENIFFLLSIISRSSININENNNKRYLHLLHLVILKNKFKKTSPKNKDKIINFFFNKIVKNFNANYIYLCYENDNNKAHYYYKRNKYKIYNKINNTFFVKKFFK